MGVSHLLHVLATLPCRKEPCYPLNSKPGEPHNQSGRFGEEKNLLPLLRFEPQIIQLLALSLYWLFCMMWCLHNLCHCGSESSKWLLVFN